MGVIISNVKDYFCKVGSFCVVMLSLLLSSKLLEVVRRNQERAPEGYRYPHFSDLISGGLYCFFIIASIRVILTPTLFKKLGEYVINPKYQALQRQERVDRFRIVFFKFLYFAFSSFIGYRSLKDAEWLPPSLGGNGTTAACWTGYPFGPYSEEVKLYYIMSLGYHLHSFAFHFFLPHRNDFLEMLLHHLIAIFLVCFSFMCNMVRAGSLVLLVHDLADLPGYAVKSSADTRNTGLTLTLYITLLLVWGYCRLYVFPIDIIWSGMFESAVSGATGAELPRLFMIGMLYILQLLHIFWYYLFIKMGFHFLTRGETQDLQNSIPSRPNHQSTSNNNIIINNNNQIQKNKLQLAQQQQQQQHHHHLNQILQESKTR